MIHRVDYTNKNIEENILSSETLPNKINEKNQNRIEANVLTAKLEHYDGENVDSSLPSISNGMKNIRERLMLDDNSDINEMFENIQNLVNKKEPLYLENIKLELANISLKISKLENIEIIQTLRKEIHILKLLRQSENPHDVS